MVEERIADKYSEQEMRCPVHLCIGQEAVAAGACEALTTDDYVLSGHRSHGHYLAKGGDLKGMIAEIYGKANGCSGGKGGSMHLVDQSVGFLGSTPIVGSTIPIAVGTSFGSVMQKVPKVTVVFFGEAATEEGVFHESINFAAVKKLPIVFVCENNQYSVYSPMSVRQPPGREVFSLARGHGVESHQGDGNNAVAVYELVTKAVEKARNGDGPSFLEFKTYRWRDHVGPLFDDDKGYRSSDEINAWRDRCPIEKLRLKMLNDGVVTDQELDQAVSEISKEIDEAFDHARSSPFPGAELLQQHTYATRVPTDP
jgi:pyruvate dehydrogenase E1 component alpha subunit